MGCTAGSQPEDDNARRIVVGGQLFAMGFGDFGSGVWPGSRLLRASAFPVCEKESRRLITVLSSNPIFESVGLYMVVHKWKKELWVVLGITPQVLSQACEH